MKKIAIILSGMPRIFDSSTIFWQKLIKELDADLFIHTWDSNTDMLNKMKAAYQPTAIIIDQQVDIDITPYESRVWPGVNIFNTLSSWYSLTRAVKLTNLYYDNTHYRPDLVIRSRFDIDATGIEIFKTSGLVIPMEPPKEPSCFYYQEQFLVPQQDLIAYGSLELINEYANTLELMPLILKNDNTIPFVSEHMLAISLYLQRVPIVTTKLKFNVIRQ